MGMFMSLTAIICIYLIIIGVISIIAYFVIKKAVKDALKEYHNERKQ